MMAAVQAGGDRQEVHEALRVHAQEAARVVKMEGGDNPLRDALRGDPAFAAVAPVLDDLLDPARYVGRAPAQVLEFLADEVDPLLERHRGLLGQVGQVAL